MAEKNLSLRGFAKKAGLSHTYIDTLKKNRDPRNNKPVALTIPTLKKIAKAMNLDVNYLFSIMDDNQLITVNTQGNDYTDVIDKITDIENGQELLDALSEMNEEEIKKLLQITEIIKTDK